MNLYLEKQLARLERKEARFVEKKTRLAQTEKKPSKFNIPIPKGLNDTLQAAFYKGFELVFQKGNRVLEKTYDKQQLELEHELMELGYQKKPSRRNLSRLTRQAEKRTNFNGLASIAEGSVLGVFGVGLPDIPIFIGVLLKSIYEIALGYGFAYNTPQERDYILKLMEASLAKPEDFLRLNAQADAAAFRLNSRKALACDLEQQTKATARALAADMITMKFIQGLPIVGVVGGVCNFACHKKIMDYVRMKYQKRYLLKKLMK